MSQTTDILQEEWRCVYGYEGIYEISNHGAVRSLTRKSKHSRGGSRTLKGRLMKNGYCGDYDAVQLSKYGKVTNHLIHRLVASSFIDNPDNKKCVNHKDGNKKNNHSYNLEWCTYSENEKHSYSELGKKPNKTNLGNVGIKARDAKPVAEINDHNVVINYWGSASEAARETGLCQGRISCVCRGETVKGKHNGRGFIYISKDEFFQYEEIRQQGHDVATKLVKANGKRFARYTLTK